MSKVTRPGGDGATPLNRKFPASRRGAEPGSSHHMGAAPRASGGLGKVWRSRPGPPPPELKRNPRPRQPERPAKSRDRASPLRGQLPPPPPRPPAPNTPCAGKGEAVGRDGGKEGRGRSPEQVPPPRVGGTGAGAPRERTQSPKPTPRKRNQLPGAELCSPLPEPEVAPRPEVGSEGGNRVEGRGLSRPRRCSQLRGFNPWWALGLPQCSVLPAVRSCWYRLGSFSA